MLHIGNKIGGQSGRSGATKNVQVAYDAAIDSQKNDLAIKLAKDVQIAFSCFQSWIGLLQAVRIVGTGRRYKHAPRIDLAVNHQSTDYRLDDLPGANKANLGSSHINGLLGIASGHSQCASKKVGGFWTMRLKGLAEEESRKSKHSMACEG